MYHDFCVSGALEPLLHSMPERAKFTNEAWEAYVAANRCFADALEPELGEGDTVWIHDLQLMLLPAILRSRGRDLRIGFFLHTPFPAADVFRTTSWRESLLRGVLGADLVGFHARSSLRNFRDAVRVLLGVRASAAGLDHNGRSLRLGAFPLGADTAEVHAVSRGLARTE